MKKYILFIRLLLSAGLGLSPSPLLAQHDAEHDLAKEILQLTAATPDQLVELIGEQLKTLGVKTHWGAEDKALLGKREVADPKSRILLVAHLDHIPNPNAPSPSIVESGDKGLIVQGTGSLDNRAGIVQIYEFLRATQNSPQWKDTEVRVLISADGSGADHSRRRSDGPLVDLATEGQPIDLALVFEPGFTPDDNAPSKLILPHQLDGHYKLELTIAGPELNIRETKHGGSGAMDALTFVIQKFQNWRREGRSVLIYGIKSKNGRSTTSAPSVTLSVSIRFADEEFSNELQHLLEEIGDELKKRGIQLQTEEDKLLWSPQEILRKSEIQRVQEAAAELGLPKPEFVRGIERGAETTLHNRGLFAVGNIGPLGRHAQTANEEVWVSSIRPRVSLCIRLAEKLSTSAQQVTP